MLQTKFLPNRPRQTGFQGRGISKPIRQIDEPRGEEERDGVADLERDAECSSEKPQPSYRHEGRVQTHQV